MEREPNVIAITGVSGVGKDFLIDKSVGDSSGTRIYSTNRHLSGMLAEQGLSIFALSSVGLDEAVRQSNRRIVDAIRSNPGDCSIVNTHIVHNRPSGLKIDRETLGQIRPRDIIAVTANPETIAERRYKDKKRNRITESISEIKEKQEIEVLEAERIARSIGARVVKLVNTESRTDENVRQIRELISYQSSIEQSHETRLSTRESLFQYILNTPNSRISMSNFDFGSLEKFEIDLLQRVDISGSEVEIASQIYNLFLTNIGFNEEAYLAFGDPDVFRGICEERMAKNIMDRESYHPYICTEAAIGIAKLLKAALNKTGHLENHLDRGIHMVPHTTYVIRLNGSNGHESEFVFDPFAVFAYSDVLLKQSGHTIDIRSNLSLNEKMVKNMVDRLISSCETYIDILNVINTQVLTGKYLPVEQTSIIKNIIKAYRNKTGYKVSYDRFNINEARHIACAIQFSDECKTDGFLISHGYMGRFSNTELSKMEKNGILSHISLKRHTDFDL